MQANGPSPVVLLAGCLHKLIQQANGEKIAPELLATTIEVLANQLPFIAPATLASKAEEILNILGGVAMKERDPRPAVAVCHALAALLLTPIRSPALPTFVPLATRTLCTLAFDPRPTVNAAAISSTHAVVGSLGSAALMILESQGLDSLSGFLSADGTTVSVGSPPPGPVPPFDPATQTFDYGQAPDLTLATTLLVCAAICDTASKALDPSNPKNSGQSFRLLSASPLVLSGLLLPERVMTTLLGRTARVVATLPSEAASKAMVVSAVGGFFDAAISVGVPLSRVQSALTLLENVPEPTSVTEGVALCKASIAATAATLQLGGPNPAALPPLVRAVGLLTTFHGDETVAEAFCTSLTSSAHILARAIMEGGMGQSVVETLMPLLSLRQLYAMQFTGPALSALCSECMAQGGTKHTPSPALSSLSPFLASLLALHINQDKVAGEGARKNYRGVGETLEGLVGALPLSVLTEVIPLRTAPLGALSILAKHSQRDSILTFFSHVVPAITDVNKADNPDGGDTALRLDLLWSLLPALGRKGYSDPASLTLTLPSGASVASFLINGCASTEQPMCGACLLSLTRLLRHREGEAPKESALAKQLLPRLFNRYLDTPNEASCKQSLQLIALLVPQAQPAYARTLAKQLVTRALSASHAHAAWYLDLLEVQHLMGTLEEAQTMCPPQATRERLLLLAACFKALPAHAAQIKETDWDSQMVTFVGEALTGCKNPAVKTRQAAFQLLSGIYTSSTGGYVLDQAGPVLGSEERRVGRVCEVCAGGCLETDSVAVSGALACIARLELDVYLAHKADIDTTPLEASEEGSAGESPAEVAFAATFPIAVTLLSSPDATIVRSCLTLVSLYLLVVPSRAVPQHLPSLLPALMAALQNAHSAPGVKRVLGRVGGRIGGERLLAAVQNLRRCEEKAEELVKVCKALVKKGLCNTALRGPTLAEQVDVGAMRRPRTRDSHEDVVGVQMEKGEDGRLVLDEDAEEGEDEDERTTSASAPGPSRSKDDGEADKPKSAFLAVAQAQTDVLEKLLQQSGMKRGKGIFGDIIKKMSKTTDPRMRTGSEYKSERAGGDIVGRNQGEMPFAYIPLHQRNLNRRYTAEARKQFASLELGGKRQVRGKAPRSKRQAKRKHH
eukprot:g5718.t1